MKINKGTDKALILLAVIIVLIAGTIVLVTMLLKTDELTEMIENRKGINTVFMVHDDGRLVFTELFMYDPGTAKGAILDIPGETGVIIEKLGRIDRIDTLYDSSKPRDYINRISQLIEQDIHYYMQIELGDAVRLVDLLEGLEMFIANPVESVDDEEIVLLPSGSIVLDGDKAASYVLYEEPDESEVDLSGRREKFVQALLKAFKEKSDYIIGDSVFSYFRDTVQSDADGSALKAFIGEMKRLDTGRIIFQRVLGARRTVDDQVLLFPHYDGKLLRETVRQTMASIASEEAVGEEELSVTIEILNSTEVTGLASRTSQIFQSYGYDVVKIGNYEGTEQVEKTVVIDRIDNITQAQRVGGIIKCGNVRTVTGFDTSIDEEAAVTVAADVTIILGKDFDGRYCKE